MIFKILNINLNNSLSIILGSSPSKIDSYCLDDSIDYVENAGLLRISIKKETEINQKLLSNTIRMLEELKSQYPKNIEIRNEV